MFGEASRKHWSYPIGQVVRVTTETDKDYGISHIKENASRGDLDPIG